MDWRTATEATLTVTLAALVVYNVVAQWRAGPDASISRVIRKAGKDHPVLTFAVGFVCGHWFW